MTGPETLDVARDAIWTIVVVSSPLMVVGPGVICASAGPAASRTAAMQPAADSIRRMKIRIVIPPASVCSNQNTPTGTMNRRNFVAPSLMRVNSTSMA